MTITAIARPPRPLVPAPELLDLAQKHGLSGYRIKTIAVMADTDVLVEEDAGARYRICTVPDGAGRRGLLVDRSPSGHPIGNLRMFTPRVTHTGPNEPWELADFDWLADKINVPAAVMQVDGFGGYRQWLLTGEDPTGHEPPMQPWHPPVAAYACWRAQARGRMRGVSLAEAVDRSDLCAALRREVINSGWLSDAALAELATR